MSKQSLRRMWFTVHKWIGLILAVLIVPLCVSGAALVWDQALDRIVNPARYAVSGATLLPLDRYIAASRGALRFDDRVAMLTLPSEGGPVVIAAAPAKAPTRPGPPARKLVYLDPPTARVLDVASNSSGLVRTLHVLHGSLMVPGVGRSIVGAIGVAMMVSCFTGLWLWWPTVGKWVRGLRWRRHRNTDTNLHYLFGFWIALPLFVLSLTGAWISFPAFFGALVGEGARPGGPPPNFRAPPIARAAQTPDQVVARAGAVQRGRVRSIAWPTEKSPDWTVAIARGDGPPVSVKVSDDDGVAVAAPDRRQTGTARLMRRIHDGEGTGPVWQAIIFVGGILPAVLAITGVIMWWRARRWRGELAERRRAKPA